MPSRTAFLELTVTYRLSQWWALPPGLALSLAAARAVLPQPGGRVGDASGEPELVPRQAAEGSSWVVVVRRVLRREVALI